MASIEIKTVQNVRIRYELGTFWERFFALALDWVVIGVAMVILSFLARSADSGAGANVIAYLFLIPFFFYTPVSEIALNGSSLGKRIMGLRIMRLDGKPCEPMDYLLRWVFRSVDLFFSLGTVAIILVGFTATRQRLGEILSNTVVVKHFPKENSLANLLKIKSLQTYTPVYEQAGYLSESEALLIKEVLDRSRKYPGPGHTAALKEMSEWVASKIGIPPLSVISERDFLLTVLRDYVALSR